MAPNERKHNGISAFFSGAIDVWQNPAFWARFSRKVPQKCMNMWFFVAPVTSRALSYSLDCTYFAMFGFSCNLFVCVCRVWENVRKTMRFLMFLQVPTERLCFGSGAAPILDFEAL